MGFHGRLGLVLFYQRVSLAFGLFVVEVHRAKGRCGSALASLEVGAHVGVYVVGSLAGFVLEVVEMRKHIDTVVFVGMLLRVDGAPASVIVLFRFRNR